MSPPSVNTGSSTVTTVLLTVVVVPLTVRLPSTNALLLTVKSPSTVTLSVNCDTALTVNTSVFALPTVVRLPVILTSLLNVASPCTTIAPSVALPCPTRPIVVYPDSPKIENSTLSLVATLPT